MNLYLALTLARLSLVSSFLPVGVESVQDVVCSQNLAIKRKLKSYRG